MADSVAKETCYHCGQAVPEGVSLYVVLDGQPRAMCCIGCRAVAQAIVDNDLLDYYRHRDALPSGPAQTVPEKLRDLELFDHSEFQRSFVRPIGVNEREADLILEGITCAACVWLNERHLAQLPGVSAVNVNYATRRARIRWNDTQIKLSDVLRAIAAIGYAAHPYDPTRSELLAQKEKRTALWRLFVAGFGMMQIMMYAIPVYMAGDGEMSPEIELLMRWASLVLTLPVVLYSSAPFFVKSLRDLRLGRLGMDVPVAVGIGSAFLSSVWATVSATGEVYFDSVAMFVFFLLCGRYLEMTARQEAVRGADLLARVLPAFAERLDLEARAERVPVSLVVPGDRLRIRPGDAFPVDGVVVEGVSSADESLLTGESRPVSKQQGDVVIGGSINQGGALTIEVSRVGDATRLAGIQRLMERAANERPRVVELADRFASWFVVALLIIAGLTWVGWHMIDPDRALWIFVSVLVVSCPCALSLATPVALTVAIDVFARHGLLVTRSNAIETFARLDHIVFDKTGTLTRGRMSVLRVEALGGVSPERVLRLAAALELASEHPIARAVEAAAPSDTLPAERVRICTGLGVEGVVEGVRLRIGRPDYVAELAPEPGTLSQDLYTGQAGSWVFIGGEQGWLGALLIGDDLRSEAVSAVSALRRQGLGVSILSGDAAEPVAAVARQVGVEDARHGLTPEAKHAAVCALQTQGAVVAVVGDGVNDAPVLAAAQLSIAPGAGTELARTQADIVLLRNDLTAIAMGRRLARRTLNIVRQNLWWSLIYNVLAIPLAIAGLVTPWMAGIGMSASSLLVVFNALRLRKESKQ